MFLWEFSQNFQILRNFDIFPKIPKVEIFNKIFSGNPSNKSYGNDFGGSSVDSSRYSSEFFCFQKFLPGILLKNPPESLPKFPPEILRKILWKHFQKILNISICIGFNNPCSSSVFFPSNTHEGILPGISQVFFPRAAAAPTKILQIVPLVRIKISAEKSSSCFETSSISSFKNIPRWSFWGYSSSSSENASGSSSRISSSPGKMHVL